MRLDDPEESEWKAREGSRDTLRGGAQDMAKDLHAFSQKCGKRFEGIRRDLFDMMTKHMEEEHGSSDT